MYKFSHDVNGNPNALHTLKFFGEELKDDFIVAEKLRKQVGYGDYLDHANYLIEKHIPKGYKETNRIIEGDRSGGSIFIHVTLTKE